MEHEPTCLSFAVDCGTLFKGAGVTVMGFVLFVGSVYLLLSAVFGRWMGYLVLVIAFSGWMILQSALWLFGFKSQGPETPVNLGPRGAEPAWVVLSAGETPGAPDFSEFEAYPEGPWFVPSQENPRLASSVLSVSGAATSFLAEQANRELGIGHEDPNALTGVQFTVDDVRFATAEDGRTNLAVVEAHFTGGGPKVILSMYHDSGSVPRYSIMFLGGSILLFAIHVPLLDRAERRRKEFLTGGTAPAWYGPA
jgi:hypothetical protein